VIKNMTSPVIVTVNLRKSGNDLEQIMKSPVVLVGEANESDVIGILTSQLCGNGNRNMIEKNQGNETNGEVTENVTLKSEIGIAKVGVVVEVVDLKVQEVLQGAAQDLGLQMVNEMVVIVMFNEMVVIGMVNETVVIVMVHNVLRILLGVAVAVEGVVDLLAQENGS